MIPKVSVTDILSDGPLIATCFDSLRDSVLVSNGHILEPVARSQSSLPKMVG